MWQAHKIKDPYGYTEIVLNIQGRLLDKSIRSTEFIQGPILISSKHIAENNKYL
jgi:hypothetical protein